MSDERQGRARFRPLLVLGALVLGVVGGAAWWSSYRDLATAREREAVLEERIRETQGRVDELRDRVERLRSDPATIERVAREEMGLVRPGDVVIVLPKDDGGDDR